MARVALSAEPCEDYVSREVVRRIIDSPRSKRQMLDMLASLPSVTPRQKTGHWRDKYEYDDLFKYYCPECHTGSDLRTTYCPNCGAKLVESEE